MFLFGHNSAVYNSAVILPSIILPSLRRDPRRNMNVRDLLLGSIGFLILTKGALCCAAEPRLLRTRLP